MLSVYTEYDEWILETTCKVYSINEAIPQFLEIFLIPIYKSTKVPLKKGGKISRHFFFSVMK